MQLHACCVPASLFCHVWSEVHVKVTSSQLEPPSDQVSLRTEMLKLMVDLMLVCAGPEGQ